MHVRHILQQKGRDVIACAEGVSLAEAARLLARHRIGALVVKDDRGALAGIISERDVVRAISQDGAGALDQAVGAYMSRAVATCTQCDTVEDLMEVMTVRRFRHVPVVEDGRLMGMISIGDVVKTRIAETMQEASSLRDYIAAVI